MSRFEHGETEGEVRMSFRLPFGLGRSRLPRAVVGVATSALIVSSTVAIAPALADGSVLYGTSGNWTGADIDAGGFQNSDQAIEKPSWSPRMRRSSAVTAMQ